MKPFTARSCPAHTYGPSILRTPVHPSKIKQINKTVMEGLDYCCWVIYCRSKINMSLARTQTPWFNCKSRWICRASWLRGCLNSTHIDFISLVSYFLVDSISLLGYRSGILGFISMSWTGLPWFEDFQHLKFLIVSYAIWYISYGVYRLFWKKISQKNIKVRAQGKTLSIMRILWGKVYIVHTQTHKVAYA